MNWVQPAGKKNTTKFPEAEIILFVTDFQHQHLRNNTTTHQVLKSKLKPILFKYQHLYYKTQTAITTEQSFSIETNYQNQSTLAAYLERLRCLLSKTIDFFDYLNNHFSFNYCVSKVRAKFSTAETFEILTQSPSSAKFILTLVF